MRKEQDPMTGFKTLELAFSQGFRMQRIPFNEDFFFTRDKTFNTCRYTYAKLDKLKVLQTVVLHENEPLNGFPCYCLFYGTLPELRGKGLTAPFVKKAIEQFTKDLPRRIHEFYIETIVDIDNTPSLSIASKLFGDASHDGVDKSTGSPSRIWQTRIFR
ncbi:MAG: hypothetical protein ACRCYW_07780 [Aeromonas sp.]|uniref:hypothetical protein n=1 Tax=Aeromonas sp. TaxID=647 RepID=UPI003F3070B5